MKKCLVLLAVLVLATTGFAAGKAASQDMSMGLGGFLSRWDADDADDPAIGLGVKGCLEVMPNVVVEARASIYRFESEDEGDEITMDVMPLEVGATYQMPLADKITAFAGGGVGYYVTSVDADLDIEDDLPGATDFDAESDNAFGFYLIGGASYQIEDNISIFANLKYTFLEVEVTLEADVVGLGHFEESEDASLDGPAIEVGGLIKF